jgi:hypothetical protein
MFFRPELASIYTQIDRPEDARRNLDRCAEIMSAGENWYGLAGNVARARGEFAARQHDWISAARSLGEAVAVYRETRLPWEEARACQVWSQAAAQQGVREIAIRQIDAALAIYRDHGAGQVWIEQANKIREEVFANAAPVAMTASIALASSFQREGAFWTISHRNRTFRVKDMKGLRYLTHLLAHPGEEFHVLDLLTAVEGVANADGRETNEDLRVTSDLGDAGEILDQRSKLEYRHRRDELRAELDEAEAAHDSGHTIRIRAELEMLDEQLTSAMGLGGRDRKAADHSERARDRIRKSIHKSLASIRENDPTLGHHLTTCIRTGYLCSYHPGPGDTSDTSI